MQEIIEQTINDILSLICDVNPELHWRSDVRDVYEEDMQKIVERALQKVREDTIKEIIDKLELNPNEDGSISPNIQHWIEKKQSQLRKLLTKAN